MQITKLESNNSRKVMRDLIWRRLFSANRTHTVHALCGKITRRDVDQHQEYIYALRNLIISGALYVTGFVVLATALQVEFCSISLTISFIAFFCTFSFVLGTIATTLIKCIYRDKTEQKGSLAYNLYEIALYYSCGFFTMPMTIASITCDIINMIKSYVSCPEAIYLASTRLNIDEILENLQSMDKLRNKAVLKPNGNDGYYLQYSVSDLLTLEKCLQKIKQTAAMDLSQASVAKQYLNEIQLQELSDQLLLINEALADLQVHQDEMQASYRAMLSSTHSTTNTILIGEPKVKEVLRLTNDSHLDQCNEKLSLINDELIPQYHHLSIESPTEPFATDELLA